MVLLQASHIQTVEIERTDLSSDFYLIFRNLPIKLQPFIIYYTVYNCYNLIITNKIELIGNYMEKKFNQTTIKDFILIIYSLGLCMNRNNSQAFQIANQFLIYLKIDSKKTQNKLGEDVQQTTFHNPRCLP